MEKKNTPEIEKKSEPIAPGRRKKISKIKEGISGLPNKKPHLDFIAALLTIPLLAITLYLNFTALKNKSGATLTPTPTPIMTQVQNNTAPKQTSEVTRIVITATPQPTANTNTCVKDIGPISIDSPNEGQTITDNPVCIDINYQAGNYCSVVWSYRINNGDWSDYSNNAVCLYNLPSGSNTFDLQIKSLSSASVKTVHRNFTYQPKQTVSQTPTVTTAPTPTST
jgi:hypothetical protein